ncbi:MAG: MobA/MobL family protein [Alphaproteobacteria bacterium]|nr:MobA/MobL family protein [Alphaproteobacteria bacterium]
MAVYDFHHNTHSRAKGASCAAALAYRCALAIRDPRTDELHDLTRKRGVVSVHSFALFGELTPAEAAMMWTNAELAERRENSVVAREVVIALPAELTDDEREMLATGYARFISGRFGVGVTVVIHRPPRHGDDRNHHAHIMFTTRAVNADRSMGAKTRELDDMKTTGPGTHLPIDGHVASQPS